MSESQRKHRRQFRKFESSEVRKVECSLSKVLNRFSCAGAGNLYHPLIVCHFRHSVCIPTFIAVLTRMPADPYVFNVETSHSHTPAINRIFISLRASSNAGYTESIIKLTNSCNPYISFARVRSNRPMQISPLTVSWSVASRVVMLLRQGVWGTLDNAYLCIHISYKAPQIRMLLWKPNVDHRFYR